MSIILRVKQYQVQYLCHSKRGVFSVPNFAARLLRIRVLYSVPGRLWATGNTENNSNDDNDDGDGDD